MLKQGDSMSRQKNGWLLSSTNFTAKCEMVFVLTQENVSSSCLILKPIERPYVPLKTRARDCPPFKRSACFYVTINRDFERFQCLNFETSFLKK